MKRKIVVLGDGAWGRALAALSKDCGHDVSVWSRRSPDTRGFKGADAIIVAIPAQEVDFVLFALEEIEDQSAIIVAAKGIVQVTGEFMHEAAKNVCALNPVFLLSGPSFAEDVTRKLPTAITLAGEDIESAKFWATALARPYFRIYASDDIMGVALGGSLKNVMAIACGISDGQGLGDSARAALTARSFSELTRLGRALGAKTETLMGLSGLGDLLLTCSSPQSRNYAFGRRIGEGMSVAEALATSNGVVEGVYSARAAVSLAQMHAIEMPIVAAVSAIIDGSSSPKQEIEKLLSRPITQEFL
jgi:glycerol-3-phosphate dehydrogenase (NAD(P)+)